MFKKIEEVFNLKYNLILLSSLLFLGVTAVLTYFLAWQNSIVNFNRKVELSDVMAYKNAGDFVLEGRFLYDDTYTFIEGVLMPWMMPPFAALVLSPLALVPDNMLYLVWSIIQLLALIIIIKLSFNEFLERFTPLKKILLIISLTFLAVAFGPNQDNFITGQINIILAAMVIIDILYVGRKNKKVEGFLVGVAAGIKILPGIFILYYLATKQWRQAVNAIGGFLSTILISSVVLWENTKYFWGELAFLKADDRNSGFAISYFNQSLRGFIDRISGNETPTFSMLWLLLSILTIAFTMTIAYAFYSKGLQVAVISVVGLGMVLAAPTSWIHYGVWVVPAVAAILGNGLNRHRTVTAILVSVPLMQQLMGKALPYLYPFILEWWVTMYMILILLIILVNKKVLENE